MKMINVEKTLGNFHMHIPRLEMGDCQIHGLIGANGCGKTTLAKLVMGILEPDSGVVDLDGLNPREITMTSQRPYLLHSSVYENLIYPLKLRKLEINKDLVDSWLQRCGLYEKRNQYARSLSSGERQKLSMIRGMIFRPKLIIIDETLSNLDPDSVDMFEKWILDIQTKNPVTWIIISHQLPHICRMCDQLHFLHEGNYVASGSANELLNENSDVRIKSFVSRETLVF